MDRPSSLTLARATTRVRRAFPLEPGLRFGFADDGEDFNRCFRNVIKHPESPAALLSLASAPFVRVARCAGSGASQAPALFSRRFAGVTTILMVWFYERDHVSLSLETRYDNETAEYVAILRHPDGRRQTERFATGEALREWLVTLEQKLASERWTADGPPHFLPDGWPDKPPMM